MALSDDSLFDCEFVKLISLVDQPIRHFAYCQKQNYTNVALYRYFLYNPLLIDIRNNCTFHGRIICLLRLITIVYVIQENNF